MDGVENCKHSFDQRRCYICHLEYEKPSEKTQLDTLHETIAELKIRISKLEEYKRLQDDINNHKETDIKALHACTFTLNEHRKKQIDENRATSKHLTDLDNWFHKLKEKLTSLEQSIKLWEITNSSQNNMIIDRLEAQKYWLSDLQTDVDLALDREFPPKKKSGLTFEEAITAFKSGKKIRFNDGTSESTIYKPLKSCAFGFEYNKIVRNHWEIVE